MSDEEGDTQETTQLLGNETDEQGSTIRIRNSKESKTAQQRPSIRRSTVWIDPVLSPDDLTKYLESDDASDGFGPSEEKADPHGKISCFKYWPRRWTVCLFIFLADCICYMDRANLSATIVEMAEIYDWSSSYQGFAFGVFFAGLVLSHLIGGYLADRYGAKIVLTVGVCWWSVFTIITPFCAQNQVAMIACRFLLGLGEGVNFPCVYNLFSRWFPHREKDHLVSIASTGVYVGTVFALLFTPPISDSLGWEAVFYIYGSVGLVWVFAYMPLGASQPRDYIVDIGDSDWAQERAFIEDTVELDNSEEVFWLDFIKSPAIWALGAGKFAYYYGFFFLISWGPTIFVELGTSDEIGAQLCAIPFGVTCISIIACGVFANYLQGDRDHAAELQITRITWIRKTFAAVALATPTAMFTLLIFVQDSYTALTCFVIMYIGNAAFVVGIAVNVLDIGPRFSGSILALTHTISSTSGFLSNVITGALLDASGGHDFSTSFLVAAIVSAAGGIIYCSFSQHRVLFK